MNQVATLVSAPLSIHVDIFYIYIYICMYIYIYVNIYIYMDGLQDACCSRFNQLDGPLSLTQREILIASLLV
jgi:hypothetical protein